MCHPFVCCNLVHTATCIACYLYGLTSIAITMDITVAGIAYLNTICSRRHCFKHTLYVCVHKCRCASHVVRRSLPVISRATVCAGTGCTTGARQHTRGSHGLLPWKLTNHDARQDRVSFQAVYAIIYDSYQDIHCFTAASRAMTTAAVDLDLEELQ